MSDMSDEELAELTKARKPSTNKELTEKARKYILQKADEADGKKVDDVRNE